MAPSNALISEVTKDTLRSLLRETAKTPKPITVEQLVSQNRLVIQKMLKNGHSHDDVADVLHLHELSIPGSVITALLSKASKKKGSKDKPREKPAEAELTVNQKQAAAITAEWERLAMVRKGFTKQELIMAMQDDINAALAAGYTFADLAALLTKNGVSIAASSLQKYHRSSQQTDKPEKSPAPGPGNKSAKPPNLPRLDNEIAVTAEEFAL